MGDMSWLWNVLAAAAPVIGNMIAPGIGGAIGTLAGGAISAFSGHSAANEAESKMLDAAKQQQLLAQQALQRVNMGADVRQLTKQGVGQLGGALASGGLLGSSLGDAAMLGVVSDVVARIAPQQTQAMLQATQLGMQPYGLLFDAYRQAGLEATKTGGLNLGGIPWDVFSNLNIDWGKIFNSFTPNAVYAAPGKSYTANTGMY